jgi:hypothetical protein
MARLKSSTADGATVGAAEMLARITLLRSFSSFFAITSPYNGSLLKFVRTQGPTVGRLDTCSMLWSTGVLPINHFHNPLGHSQRLCAIVRFPI